MLNSIISLSSLSRSSSSERAQHEETKNKHIGGARLAMVVFSRYGPIVRELRVRIVNRPSRMTKNESVLFVRRSASVPRRVIEQDSRVSRKNLGTTCIEVVSAKWTLEFCMS